MDKIRNESISLLIEELTKEGCLDLVQKIWQVKSSNLQDYYCLPYRINRENLVKKVSTMLKSAEQTFRSEVLAAQKLFEQNSYVAAKLDEILQKPFDSSGTSPLGVSGKCRKLLCFVCNKGETQLKRHMEDAHGDLQKEAFEFALRESKLLYHRLDADFCQDVALPTNKKRSKTDNPNFVRKKENYRDCPLCDHLSLQINLPGHLANKHGLKGPDYKKRREDLCRAPKTVPSIFTKLVNNVRVMKSEEEIKVAEEIHGETIIRQEKELKELKISQNYIDALKKKIVEVDCIEDYHDLKEKIKLAEQKFKEIRYAEKRRFSTSLKKWRQPYLTYLETIRTATPQRCINMAMDVLISWEKKRSSEVNLKNLRDPVSVRDILLCFSEISSLTSTSKIKYMRQFLGFSKFILIDPATPEMFSDDEESRRLLDFERLQREVHATIKAMSKDKGRDLMATRERAKAKIVSKQDLESLKTEILQFMENTWLNKDQKKTFDEILEIRNELITEATVLMGRRSKEVIFITKSEVRAAEQIEVNGAPMWVVLVKEQKSRQSGRPAPVVFSDIGYKVLTHYLEFLLPAVCPDKFSELVFPRLVKKISEKHVAEPLTFKDHHSILQKKNLKGKRLSSRAVRGSIVTHNRSTNASLEVQKDLAESMCHTLPVANTNYAYQSLLETVERSQTMLSSTPLKEALPVAESHSYSPIPPPTAPGSSKNEESLNDPDISNVSTPRDLRRCSVGEKRVELRTRKVRIHTKPLLQRSDYRLVLDEVKTLASRLQEEQHLDKLFNPVTGRVKVQYLRRNFNNEHHRSYSNEDLKTIALSVKKKLRIPK